MTDFAYLPAVAHNFSYYIPSCVFSGLIFKILKDSFNLSQTGQVADWVVPTLPDNCLHNLS